MELTPAPDRVVWRELPAIGLGALVRRHAASFARVRACGDWSDPHFRRVVGPLLLAFARHAHLLPTAVDAPAGSLLDAGLHACSEAVLRSAAAGPAASAQTIPAGSTAAPGNGWRCASAAQEAIVLHALSPWVVLAVSGWQVVDSSGGARPLAAQPLSDQLVPATGLRGDAAARISHYRTRPVAGCPAAANPDPGMYALGMVLLMRALPAPALQAACAASPPLLERALALAMAGADDAPVACRADALPAALPAAQVGYGAGPGSLPLAAQRPLRDAMCALIACGQWTVNMRRARLWHLDGRLYLVWKTAADELSRRLSVDRASLLPSLLQHGIVVACPAPGPGVQAQPAGAVLAIRTPYTDALPVVELTDAGGWLQCVQARLTDHASPDEPKPDCARQAVLRREDARGGA